VQQSVGAGLPSIHAAADLYTTTIKTPTFKGWVDPTPRLPRTRSAAQRLEAGRVREMRQDEPRQNEVSVAAACRVRAWTTVRSGGPPGTTRSRQGGPKDDPAAARCRQVVARKEDRRLTFETRSDSKRTAPIIARAVAVIPPPSSPQIGCLARRSRALNSPSRGEEKERAYGSKARFHFQLGPITMSATT